MVVCKRLQEWIISRQANILKTKEIDLGAKGSCKALGVYDFFTSFSVGVGDWTHGLMCIKCGLYHWTIPLYLKKLFIYLQHGGLHSGPLHARKIYEYMDGQMDRQTGTCSVRPLCSSFATVSGRCLRMALVLLNKTRGNSVTLWSQSVKPRHRGILSPFSWTLVLYLGVGGHILLHNIT